MTDFERFGDLKNLITLNILKEKLVNSSLLGSFYPNHIQDGGEPPTSFSHVTSTNEGISLQNFLIFSLNSFDTLV